MLTEVFFHAFIGGGLIGLGAFLLLLFNGRIAGVSGIAYTALATSGSGNHWRWYFITGLIMGPLLAQPFGFTLPDTIVGAFDTTDSPLNNTLVMLLGGILVGFGTQLGSGCTSGHGICGISRLSSRSILATCIFMLSAFATVTLIKHSFGGI
ncbi:YeeE/YedE family protein [Paraglaciecola chathamensis]|uniref:YeeE/YedE family protein n=1 Tax=Paraglaciecola chathamensis TaxID=368405 RepID=UPI00270584F5|nr:YeeE/YedE thiosulfate transporter family protein [Paraglaciecola chathamensis]MDO6557636.1 YeeE/YedE thiosulfate transporter family protein [Paraglaciecola chathamensis]